MANASKRQARSKSRDGMNRKEQVSDLLSQVEKRISKETGKASLSDFIRLIQLERELEEEESPREITITWVETLETLDTEK